MDKEEAMPENRHQVVLSKFYNQGPTVLTAWVTIELARKDALKHIRKHRTDWRVPPDTTDEDALNNWHDLTGGNEEFVFETIEIGGAR
jgi:hypothetical protein